MMLARPDHGEMTRRGMAAADMSVAARKGWAGVHRAWRCQAAKKSWAHPKKRARRCAAIKRAMCEPETRSTLSNSRLLASALKALAPISDIAFPAMSGLNRRAAWISLAGQLCAHSAYEAALAAAAYALGLTVKKARRGNAAFAAGRARAIASYLTVTLFRVPVRNLAAARGVDRRGLRRVIRDVEARRDDPIFETQLSAIEYALARKGCDG